MTEDDTLYVTAELPDTFVIGQTYTREEINAILGISPICECRIVEPGHVCPD